MDDDKQVKELTTQTTIGRFLNRPIRPDDKDREHYDLEKEFAKAAKNRSPMIPLVVVAFLVVLAAGSWLASQFTELASQESSVSIGSFEDLKLKEIFDTARKNKKDLESLQVQMDELTQESQARVALLTQTGNSKADIASVNDATGNQAKEILAQTARQVAAERASLAAALAPLKAQAEEVQKRIDSYDDRIGQMNRKNQQVLDTQQRLFDLEKQKMIDQYESRLQAQVDDAAAALVRVREERDALVSAMRSKHADDIRKLILKYNPVISDGFLQAWLAADGAAPALYPELVQPERIASRALVPADLTTAFEERVSRTKQLLERLRAIPFENSVPGLLNTLDKAIADSLVGYNGYLAPLADHMTQLDGEIAAREAVISERDQTIWDLEAKITELNDQIYLLSEERKAEQLAWSEEKTAATAYLARWTGAVNDFVLTLREDGVFVDVRSPDDWMVVLKPERAKALALALEAAANLPPPATPAPGARPAPTPPPVNLAVVRDGLNNGELGTVTVELQASGVWRAKLVKQNDAKKPFKAFDRVVLTLPATKK